MDRSDDTGADRALPRMIRRVGQLSLTLAIMGAAVGAGVTGYGVLDARASAADSPPAAPRTAVAPEILRLQDRVTLTRRFTGQFEAQQDVALGFEEGGTIAEVLVREGEAVAEGTLIARLDTRLLEAERQRLIASRASVDAQAELARRTNARQMTLLSEGHVTQQRVDETSLQLAQLEASLAEIDAGIVALEVRLSKAEIRAPFAGRIGARLLDSGAVAGPGAGVVTLLEDGPARFRVALDPDLAASLATGTEVDIETSGARLSARLAELAPDLDAATRSRIAYFDLVPGMPAPPARASGDVILTETLDERGVWVPLRSLRPGPRGAWTLLVLDAEHIVGLEAAEILHLAGDMAYVRGTFADGTAYLSDGTHRVVPGEAVTMAGME